MQVPSHEHYRQKYILKGSYGPRDLAIVVQEGRPTGQVPPARIRSKDNASGMPNADAEACESMDDSPKDLGFSSP